MIRTGILKSWYAESVNFMVVLTFLCKMFHMCIPAVVTLVLYELFLPYIQLGKRSILMWISVCNISITTETLLLGTTAKSLAQSCLHSPFGYVDALMRAPHPVFVALSWTFQYVHVSLTEEHRTGCSVPSVASPMLSRGAASSPLSGCQHSSWCSPGYHLPSLLQGHVSGSWAMWCPSGHPFPFLARLLSSCAAPTVHKCLELFLPKGRTWRFPFLNYMRLLSACPGLSWWQHSSFSPSAAPPSLISSAALLRVCSLSHYSDAAADLPKKKTVITFSK